MAVSKSSQRVTAARPTARTVTAATALGFAVRGLAADKERKFLSDIQSDDADVRYAAWSIAEQMDPEVIPELSKLLLAGKPGVRKAAAEALTYLVHSVGEEPGAEKRKAVVAKLIELLSEKRHKTERVTALRHLSLLAEAEAVPAIAKLVALPDLREEVAFCLERIPGKTAEEALLDAYEGAAEEFKPRILAALGHRRTEEAVPLTLAAMQSSNIEIAVAAMKAFARIGARPTGKIQWPAYEPLSDWQKIEYADSMLRYADARVEKGSPGEAWPIYQAALEREEEHWQCAAIVGLAKMKTSQAAAAIFPKLSSPNDKVRITAEQAWDKMKS